MDVVLASGSPRRHELLRRLIPSFQVLTSRVEETGRSVAGPEPILSPIELPATFRISAESDPRLWAWRKAADVIAASPEGIELGSIVLGADTVVIGPGRLLGKPKSREDALGMLRFLRGREHYVVTGYALLKPTLDVETLHVGSVASCVHMRDYSDVELEGYVATEEPMDKAGAYALQGLGGSLVEKVEGCVTNVVGLPLCAVRAALADNGAEVLPYPQEGYCKHCATSVG